MRDDPALPDSYRIRDLYQIPVATHAHDDEWVRQNIEKPSRPAGRCKMGR